MKWIGKPSIHPVIFYSGKISGYIAWTLLLMELLQTDDFSQFSVMKSTALFLIVIGLILIFASLVNLGASTRLGLPEENTEFKTQGLYRISRNPMYLGFDLLSCAAILYMNCGVTLVLGVYSMFAYHRIILAEEKFLLKRFGDKYIEYRNNVRRYM